MTSTLITLSAFPELNEFYKEYWNKKPFVVRAGVPSSILNDLITGDELAGLSLEDDIRSRIVQTAGWACEYGPFKENKFSKLGEKNWSLLVQDVEKNHPKTKKIVKFFKFSPSWLMDDVMVSYSTPGGGVGPHLDSYHVFLVQGAGKRRWKIGSQMLSNEKYINGIDLKVLAEDFSGNDIEMNFGDVLYVPPYFAHSGVTIEESLTYSIGFLGPSIAELLTDFGQFIEEKNVLNKRYDGKNLDYSSAGENMSMNEVENFRGSLKDILNDQLFELWLRNYFKNDD
jgi:50S ribosomal protein L16 3-hydroxylase